MQQQTFRRDVRNRRLSSCSSGEGSVSSTSTEDSCESLGSASQHFINRAFSPDHSNGYKFHSRQPIGCTCELMRQPAHHPGYLHKHQSENMQTRPLPIIPGENQRYQNDSPFRQKPADNRLSSKDGSSMTKISQQDAKILRDNPWFQPNMSRERVMESLNQQDIGSFLVRESTTHAGCFALSVKVPKFDNPTGVAHYLIQRTPTGAVKIKGLEKEWTNLSSLVVHHTIMPELLPCTLKMPRRSTLRDTPNRNSSNSVCRQSTSSTGSLDFQVNHNNNDIDKLAARVKDIPIH